MEEGVFGNAGKLLLGVLKLSKIHAINFLHGYCTYLQVLDDKIASKLHFWGW
jgi:hypothetical protein